jgi:hypothetical protein
MLLKKKTKVAELKESGDSIEERKYVYIPCWFIILFIVFCFYIMNGNSLSTMLHNLSKKSLYINSFLLYC